KIYTTTNLDMMKAAQKAVDRGLREVDRSQGFRGARQHLADEEAIRQFNSQNHLKILDEVGNIDYGRYRTQQSLMEIKTPLKEDPYYDGVILGGIKNSGFEVQVGNQKGTILPEKMTWAAAASQLKPGDVVQVKLSRKEVTVAKAEKKGKAAKP